MWLLGIQTDISLPLVNNINTKTQTTFLNRDFDLFEDLQKYNLHNINQRPENNLLLKKASHTNFTHSVPLEQVSVETWTN